VFRESGRSWVRLNGRRRFWIPTGYVVELTSSGVCLIDRSGRPRPPIWLGQD